jgi:hypothetical protein
VRGDELPHQLLGKLPSVWNLAPLKSRRKKL